jgi:hypothetical protein
MTEYINTFHDYKNPISKKVFYTDVKPSEYKGYLIYHRINAPSEIKNGAHVFDIILNGKCIGQYAGPNGARQFIDNLEKA